MSTKPTPEQETWIEAQVAAGDFASVEGAARQSIDGRVCELGQDEGDEQRDRIWSKSLVDEARATIARGDALTFAEHRARRAALRK